MPSTAKIFAYNRQDRPGTNAAAVSNRRGRRRREDVGPAILCPGALRRGRAVSAGVGVVLIAVGLVAGLATALVAQSGRLPALTGDAAVSRIGNGFVLDGRSQESAWQGVAPLPVVTYEPAYGQAPTERTEIRVAHDDTHLYVAARLYESDVSRIRRNSLYRDRWSGDDRFGVLIDSFNDNETGLWFWTTPNGIRGDALVTDDGGSVSNDWNTHWEVAVDRGADGWFVEMRIPLSSLGFQRTEGVVVMGLVAHRDLTSRNERHVYPDITPDSRWLRPSVAMDVSLEGVSSGRPVYVSPYVLAGGRREARLEDGGTTWTSPSTGLGEAGVDVRYPIRPNLTVDFTVNTDFAQVEVDDQQVNLTRFGLFFPEKRQFFLERAGIFAFSTGGADRVFHSRRIGLDGGEPVRILGGGRLAGRIGDWDVGLLDLQTQSTAELPAVNHGVVRLRRRVFNDYSTAGAILTTRLGANGSYNVATGLDSQVRIRGDDYIGIHLVRTFDDRDDARSVALRDDGRGASPFDASLLRVRAYRASQQGFRYFVSGRFVGPIYDPAMGFLLRPDITDFQYSFSWSRIFGEGSAVRQIDPFQLFGNVVLRNDDRSIESAMVEYDTDITWKSGWGIWQDFELYYDDLRDPASFPAGSTVPAGSYAYFRTEGGLNMPPGRLLRASINWGTQRFYDGRLWNVGVSPVWNVSPHLTLVASYGLNVVRFPARDEGFDSHLAQLRVQTALDTRLSMSAFLQYSSVSDLGAANVRLRYNLAEGRDLWVVWDEGLRLDRDRLDPRPPLSTRRALLVKYSQTFGGR
jgi:hypothetical protein